MTDKLTAESQSAHVLDTFVSYLDVSIKSVGVCDTNKTQIPSGKTAAIYYTPKTFRLHENGPRVSKCTCETRSLF